MQRLRWRNYLLMLLILPMVLGIQAGAQTQPAPKTSEVRHTVTGQLMKEFAVGGETTGWAVLLTEPKQIGGKKLTRIGIDPAGQKLDSYESKRVEITGILKKRAGIERGEYWVIVVEKISPASKNP